MKPRDSFLVFLMVAGCIASSRTFLCQAWVMMPCRPPSARRPAAASALKSSRHDEVSPKETDEEDSMSFERIVISGVSVSPKGFHVLFKTRKGILPLPITRGIQDSHRATSPESLTILQLLSHVDMAGAVLPPETLAKMAIYQCETERETTTSSSVSSTSNESDNNGNLLAKYMEKALPNDCLSKSYKDAHPWFQSRISLPQITLDQVTLIYDTETEECQCQLECAVPKDVLQLADEKEASSSASASLMVSVTPDLVEPLSYQYHPETSPIFTSLALALRYKAPIVLLLVQDHDHQRGKFYFPPQRLDRDFPQRTSAQKLHQQSSRISETIERGFEINKLTGALQIAKRLGDVKAVERIQAKLDEYDSMDELPCTTTNTTTSSSSSSRSSSTSSTSTSSSRNGGGEEPEEVSDDWDQNSFQ
jgi:hypothetical protein